MGLVRTKGRTNSPAQRLAQLAAELEPERPPWFVWNPSTGTPSQGWWWIPKGLEQPQFLGHNRARAEINLLNLADAHYAPSR